ncbi:MAG: S9 family peptidase [Chloroflexota bacterium]|nr:S9 family peptidase [Chloroflexota bacterium]
MTKLTAEMVVDGLVPRDVRMNPDGRVVAFVVAPVGQRDEHPASAIWLAPTDGATAAHRLTLGTTEDRAPRWSPDGTWLVFLSDRRERGKAQLHQLPLAGGEAEALTDWPSGIAEAVPLPDGRTVALLAVDPRSEEEERRERERDDAEVFGERWPCHRLRLLDLATREVRTVEALGNRHVAEVAPSPDGTRLAVLTWPTPELEASLRHVELHMVDAMEGEVHFVCPLPTGGSGLAWVRDDRLSYLAHLAPDWRGGSAVFAVDLPDRSPHPVAVDLAGCPIDLCSGPHGESLVLVAEGLDTWTGQLEPSGGGIRRLAHLPGEAWNLSASADGRTVALIRSTSEDPANVWAGSPAGKLVRLTDLRRELRQVAWGRQERLAWTAPDGRGIDGLLLLPPEATRADGPFPLVTLVHGGPYGRFADGFQLDWSPSGQWLATAGYAVLLPNPRGGLGHGHAFADQVAGTVGEGDWGDIQAGIDVLIEDGVADPDRLGIGGWSQGGFMTAWAVGQTDRFKVAVMGAGVSDWGMMVAESDLPHFEAMLGGSTGWEGPGPHRHGGLSPISFVGRVRTPVLVLHGAADERVPVSQGRFFARGLREHGVPHELVVYPREPHEIHERNHQLDLLRRTRAWITRWLGPGKGGGGDGPTGTDGRPSE